MSHIERRDRVTALLDDLRNVLELDPRASHDFTDKELTKELKSIRSDEIGPPPETSNMTHYPVWQTIATAAAYASEAGLWSIKPQRRIQNYLPNNDPQWLSNFKKDWEKIRLKKTSDAIDLLVLILNINPNMRATFRTMVKANPNDL